MAAQQAPPFLGFTRQEHWSGLPFPSPMRESESEVAQSCPTPSDPMDCSLPGSSIRGIFQARVLEWAAIAFSSFATTTYPISCSSNPRLWRTPHSHMVSCFFSVPLLHPSRCLQNIYLAAPDINCGTWNLQSLL